jgi:hypothetical protein
MLLENAHCSYDHRHHQITSVRTHYIHITNQINVAYLLHARTVELQKPRNTVHYATIDEAVFSLCRAESPRDCCYATLG